MSHGDGCLQTWKPPTSYLWLTAYFGELSYKSSFLIPHTWLSNDPSLVPMSITRWHIDTFNRRKVYNFRKMWSFGNLDNQGWKNRVTYVWQVMRLQSPLTVNTHQMSPNTWPPETAIWNLKTSKFGVETRETTPCDPLLRGKCEKLGQFSCCSIYLSLRNLSCGAQYCLMISPGAKYEPGGSYSITQIDTGKVSWIVDQHIQWRIQDFP